MLVGAVLLVVVLLLLLVVFVFRQVHRLRKPARVSYFRQLPLPHVRPGMRLPQPLRHRPHDLQPRGVRELRELQKARIEAVRALFLVAFLATHTHQKHALLRRHPAPHIIAHVSRGFHVRVDFLFHELLPRGGGGGRHPRWREEKRVRSVGASTGNPQCRTLSRARWMSRRLDSHRGIEFGAYASQRTATSTARAPRGSPSYPGAQGSDERLMTRPKRRKKL